MKAETINQFLILQFLESKFEMDKLDLTLSDGNTIEVADKNGELVYFTTKPDDECVRVDKSVFFNAMD